MFVGHPGGTKNTMVLLTWALSAVATGTGFYLVHREGDLSKRDRGYLIAAATLAAVALFFLTGLSTDYLVDVVNMSEYHVHGMVLAWACLVAALGIWWWVFNTRLVDRNDKYLLTSAISTTIAVAFLTGAVLMERGEKIPVLDKVEQSMKRVGDRVTPRKKKSSPKRSPSKKKSSPKRK